MTSLYALTILHTLNSHAAVKLLSKNLILLAETVKFTGQVMILSSKASSMLLKSLLFIQGISLVTTQLLVLATRSFDITATAVQFVFLLLETNLSIPDLIGQISITVFLSLEVLTGIKILS